MPKLVRVERALSAVDHNSLRENIPAVNKSLPPSASLKWRALGKAGLTLLERGQYEKAQNIPGSLLAGKDPNTVAEAINTEIRVSKFARRMLNATTTETDY